MPRPSHTAYPRLKHSITAEELLRCYTPSIEEQSLAETSARGPSAKLGFLLLLKTSQTLGRFISISEIPKEIIDHIATFMGLPNSCKELDSYDQSGTRLRHIRMIRKSRGLKPFDLKAFKVAEDAVRKASFTRDDVIDLINIAIEELVKNSCELPSFKSLVDLAQAEKRRANQGHIEMIFERLNESQKSEIDQALQIEPKSTYSDWNLVKQDPGNPSPYHLKDLLVQLKTGKAIGLQDALFEDIPLDRLEQFATDAKTLNISRMNRMESKKKYALAACLFRTQKSQALDDIGEMIIRCMQKIHTRAERSLENYLKRHRDRTDQLISKLENVALAASEPFSVNKLSHAVKMALGPSPHQVVMECREHLAYKDSNHFPFLWNHFKSQRSVLFQALESLDIQSTSQDHSLLSAITFICQNKLSSEDWLSSYRWNGHQVEYLVDLSWIPESWYKFVTGEEKKGHPITKIDRRNFEVCVFTHVMWELKSGDLFIVGSQNFSDFRKQFISWEEYKKGLPQFLNEVGLPTHLKDLIEELKSRLTKVARETDRAFPGCTAIKFINGKPVLTKLNRKRTPQQLAVLEAIIESRMPRVSILDALADTFRWVGLSKFFRPLSGQMSRLDDLDLEEKHISTLFCYGCNLGPTQTVRSLKNSNRKQLAYFHQRHFTENKIHDAITAVINEYNRFDLPKCWGSEKSASADGTKWDLYEQNLLSEYHIRYGGYGGIGYYHTSSTYIALFSHFIPCGLRETTYVLDGLLKNKSDIQPDIIYGDSHAQNAAAFGLSFFLGIHLMPRIKNWKKLTLYKPSKMEHYQHIEPLFSGEVIEQNSIEPLGSKFGFCALTHDNFCSKRSYN